MNKQYNEVYAILSKINKLDAHTYSYLLSQYGELLVNQVIEDMIDEKEKNLFKFDYYISRVIAYDEFVSMNNFDMYGLDVSSIPLLSKEDNIKLATEIHSVVQEIEKLLASIGYTSDGKNYYVSWISDKVSYCIDNFNDREKLDKLKKLYNKFLFKRNALVEANLRLVIMVAKQFNKSESMFNEAIQYGNMGLMKAAEKYNPEFNTSFATYAYYWIKQSITKEISGVIYSVSISISSVRLYYEMKKVCRILFQELGREPSDLEIANYMGISEEKIVSLKQTFLDTLSLNESFPGNDNSDLVLMDTIEDKSLNIEDKVISAELKEQLYECMREHLTESEFFVIESRFGLRDGKRYTLENVGLNMGVTRERIRQIETKAIRKLQRKCKNLIIYLR